MSDHLTSCYGTRSGRRALKGRAEGESRRAGRWFGPPIFRSKALILGSLLMIAVAANRGLAADSKQEKVKPLPPIGAVRDAVRRHFAVQTGHLPGDILSRSMVAPLFDQLGLMGWKVLDKKAILRHVPKETDFVVRVLRTDSGRQFMRQIASMPGGYDRLYRLAVLPRGRQTVADLVRGKGGAEFVQYLTESRGGHNLGRMLKNAPNGTKFNEPVGFLFTEDALLQRLEKSYGEERKRREPTSVQGR